MRSSLLILLLMPLADAVLLVPAFRWFGLWMGAWLLAVGLLGLLVLRQARERVRQQRTARAGWTSMQGLLDNQRTVLAGLLLIWPGLISDVAAFVLIATAPQPLGAAAEWEHPLMLGRRSGC